MKLTRAAFQKIAATDRPDVCTCHPADNPPRPCPGQHALAECRAKHNYEGRRGVDIARPFVDNRTRNKETPSHEPTKSLHP